jgi:hypothetical protein
MLKFRFSGTIAAQCVALFCACGARTDLGRLEDPPVPLREQPAQAWEATAAVLAEKGTDFDVLFTNLDYSFPGGFVGDWNGDGRAEFALGANLFFGGPRPGEPEVDAKTWPQFERTPAADSCRDTDPVCEQEGSQLAAFHDVDADGRADLLLATFYYLRVSEFAGGPIAARGPDWDALADLVVYGTPGETSRERAPRGRVNLPATDRASLTTDMQPGLVAREEWQARPLGDVDGDGKADLVVTREFYSGSVLDSDGPIDVSTWLNISAGKPDPRAPRTDVQLLPGTPIVEALGDVDGDGLAEFIATLDDGSIYIVSGKRYSASRDVRKAGTRVVPQAAERLIVNSPRVGDLDGDGFDDFALLVELDAYAPAYAHYLFYGHSDRLSGELETSTADALFEWKKSMTRLAEAGDVNGDGVADLVVIPALQDLTHDQVVSPVTLMPGGARWVGHYQMEHPEIGEPPAPEGCGPRCLWRTTPTLDRRLGSLSVTAGDIDGDGFSDLVINTSNLGGLIYGRRDLGITQNLH